MSQPGGETLADELTDGRARHYHPLINIKFQPAKPGFVGQIGRRDPLIDPTGHQLGQLLPFAASQTRGADLLADIRRQMQARQNELYRLIPRIIGTMTIKQTGGIKLADRPAHHVVDGTQLADRLVDDYLFQNRFRVE